MDCSNYCPVVVLDCKWSCLSFYVEHQYFDGSKDSLFIEYYYVFSTSQYKYVGCMLVYRI